MEGVVIAIIILVLLFVGLVAYRNQQSGKAVKPGPGIDHLNPPQPQKFVINNKPQPKPGFTIISRTDGRPSSPPRNTRPGKPPVTGTKGFDTTGVRMNLTAICSLTGSKVADCNCERHIGIK